MEHEQIDWFGRDLYAIRDMRDMPEFFMTLVSPGEHWMFVSSRGALTAGRSSPERALFPYTTVDKVCYGRNHTGPRTVVRDGRGRIWEPFADWTPRLWRSRQDIARSVAGDCVCFIETNLDWNLEFAYSWTSSGAYGFVRQARLRNLAPQAQDLEVLDGLRDLVSPGATRPQITEFSCLIDAYKDNVVDPAGKVAVYSLSALVTDKAEAAEALSASVAWTVGAEEGLSLSLDVDAYDDFLAGKPFAPCRRSQGRTNDFLAYRRIGLAANGQALWLTVADRDLNGAAVDDLAADLDKPGIERRVLDDVAAGASRLRDLIARADGWSLSAGAMPAWHHASNVLFNIMRGGLPGHDHEADVADFIDFVGLRNKAAAAEARTLLAAGGAVAYRDLRARLGGTANQDLKRLAGEYLPLTFSRRHGDPSRPWNLFAIKVQDENGAPVMNYQGNWRDIFQNWEGLALSFPDYAPAFVAAFLNATTLDGYNPYRVTRAGADWEKLEPDNPWSNIGYWSDHQIVYLQRLVEQAHAFDPDWLAKEMAGGRYSYIAVPYRIAAYADICRHPKSTIAFDTERDRLIESRVEAEGSDARLVHGADGRVYHAGMAEKVLTLLCAKLLNFVPGGGIWMNTQRPEWNDANNALVGNGLSVVTLAQVRRAVAFWRDRFGERSGGQDLPAELAACIAEAAALYAETDAAAAAGQDSARRRFMDRAGAIADAYRAAVYRDWRFGGARQTVPDAALATFLAAALRHIDHSLALQKRDDGLYHSYNILGLSEGAAAVSRLPLMLEGQVALLGSGLLDAESAADLLEAVGKSDLYRADQNSFMLYPRKELADFQSKNRLDAAAVESIGLLKRLAQRGDTTVIVKGGRGYRFAPEFANQERLEQALARLAGKEEWRELARADGPAVLALYESVFAHRGYTGRSGTMYAYEGIGSIYWHMVSKLLLANAEALRGAADGRTAERLLANYRRIRDGLGYRKDARAYGAFPWEPYSHTPMNGKARQPGMTGQVKEELLTRAIEHGVVVAEGRIGFVPAPLLADEALSAPGEFEGLPVPAGAVAFRFCGVAVVRGVAAARVRVELKDGGSYELGPTLGRELSDALFSRRSDVAVLRVL